MAPDAMTTVASVLYVLREAMSLATAMKQAVALGVILTRRRPSWEGSLAASCRTLQLTSHGYRESCCLNQR